MQRMDDLSPFVNATEYMRRNSAHASAVGAHANTKVALARVLKMKRPPVWLVAALEGIERRTAIAHPEVAAWRNSAPDNPYGAALPEVPVTLEQVEQLAKSMWKGESIPGRVLRFGAAVLGLADAARSVEVRPELAEIKPPVTANCRHCRTHDACRSLGCGRAQWLAEGGDPGQLPVAERADEQPRHDDGSPAPEDSIAKAKRIMRAIDTYFDMPTAVNRSNVRGVVLTELEAAARTATTHGGRHV